MLTFSTDTAEGKLKFLPDSKVADLLRDEVSSLASFQSTHDIHCLSSVDSRFISSSTSNSSYNNDLCKEKESEPLPARRDHPE